MIVTLGVVYRPQWVSTFDDARYLETALSACPGLRHVNITATTTATIGLRVLLHRSRCNGSAITTEVCFRAPTCWLLHALNREFPEFADAIAKLKTTDHFANLLGQHDAVDTEITKSETNPDQR